MASSPGCTVDVRGVRRSASYGVAYCSGGHGIDRGHDAKDW